MSYRIVGIMEDKLKIKIRVADKEFPMTISRADEEKIRKAAKAVNDKIAGYRKQYDVSDPNDYLAMAALQTSIENIDREENYPSGTILRELVQLNNTLEEYLEQEIIEG